jgi:hypothetical protein
MTPIALAACPCCLLDVAVVPGRNGPELRGHRAPGTGLTCFGSYRPLPAVEHQAHRDRHHQMLRDCGHKHCLICGESLDADGDLGAAAAGSDGAKP